MDRTEAVGVSCAAACLVDANKNATPNSGTGLRIYQTDDELKVLASRSSKSSSTFFHLHYVHSAINRHAGSAWVAESTDEDSPGTSKDRQQEGRREWSQHTCSLSFTTTRRVSEIASRIIPVDKVPQCTVASCLSSSYNSSSSRLHEVFALGSRPPMMAKCLPPTNCCFRFDWWCEAECD